MLKVMKRLTNKNERGFTLIEATIAIALLGIIGVAFLGAQSTSFRANFIADRQTTAFSLARGEMEYVKDLPYVIDATSYSVDPELITTGYTINVSAVALNTPDDGIQTITVSVQHQSEVNPIITLDDYKVDR